MVKTIAVLAKLVLVLPFILATNVAESTWIRRELYPDEWTMHQIGAVICLSLFFFVFTTVWFVRRRSRVAVLPGGSSGLGDRKGGEKRYDERRVLVI